MRRSATQIATAFAVLVSAAALLLVQAPTASASPHHQRPAAAGARAHAARHVPRPPAHRKAARALTTRVTHQASRPAHPAHGRQAKGTGRGRATHARPRPQAHRQRAATPAPAALAAATEITTPAPFGAAGLLAAAPRPATAQRRATPPRPSRASHDQAPPTATGHVAGTSPLQKLADGLTKLTRWSPLRGPLGWLILAMASLALLMIAAACTTGRGGAWHSVRRALTIAR